MIEDLKAEQQSKEKALEDAYRQLYSIQDLNTTKLSSCKCIVS
jgi:hypothetical protein